MFWNFAIQEILGDWLPFSEGIEPPNKFASGMTGQIIFRCYAPTQNTCQDFLIVSAGSIKQLIILSYRGFTRSM